VTDTLAVIFDMDGVLVNSYHAHFESWQQTASKYGVSITEDQFARSFGRTSREIIPNLWPGRFNDAAVAAFDRDKEAAYRDILRRNFPAMDGAADLIAALHDAGFRLAIGSSAPPENLAVAMERLPNANLISATVTGAEVKHGKPNPQVFLIAAGKLGIDPRHCAVIEDAPPGLEAARRAGMAAVGLTGTAPRDALSSNADIVVDSLRELMPQLIADLIRRPRPQPKAL